MTPVGELGTLLQDFGAPRQERTHGERQDLRHHRRLAGRLVAADVPEADRRDGMTLGRAAIPLAGHRDELHVATERLHFLVIRFFQRPVPAQDVGDLPDHQPQVRQVERNVLEPKHRACVRLMLRENLSAQLEPWQRHAPLDAPMHFEQLQVHVHRLAELGMRVPDRAKLHRFTGVGSRRSWWPGARVGHCRDHTHVTR